QLHMRRPAGEARVAEVEVSRAEDREDANLVRHRPRTRTPAAAEHVDDLLDMPVAPTRIGKAELRLLTFDEVLVDLEIQIRRQRLERLVIRGIERLLQPSLESFERQTAMAVVHDQAVDGLGAQGAERSVLCNDWHAGALPRCENRWWA